MARSKTPRGRPDPLRQVPDRSGFHLAATLDILEEDRTELDDPQGGLAPGDDGVHAGTVAVVRADAAVAVAIQRRSVAACPAVSLAGDQINKRLFLGPLPGLPLSWAGEGCGAAGDFGQCRLLPGLV